MISITINILFKLNRVNILFCDLFICLVKLSRKIRSDLFILMERFFILISITINSLFKLNRVNIVKLSREIRVNLGPKSPILVDQEEEKWCRIGFGKEKREKEASFR